MFIGDPNTTADAHSNGISSSEPASEISVQQILSRGLGNHGDPGTDDVADLTGEESFEELFGRFAEMKSSFFFGCKTFCVHNVFLL